LPNYTGQAKAYPACILRNRVRTPQPPGQKHSGIGSLLRREGRILVINLHPKAIDTLIEIVVGGVGGVAEEFDADAGLDVFLRGEHDRVREADLEIDPVIDALGGDDGIGEVVSGQRVDFMRGVERGAEDERPGDCLLKGNVDIVRAEGVVIVEDFVLRIKRWRAEMIEDADTVAELVLDEARDTGRLAEEIIHQRYIGAGEEMLVQKDRRDKLRDGGRREFECDDTEAAAGAVLAVTGFAHVGGIGIAGGNGIMLGAVRNGHIEPAVLRESFFELQRPIEFVVGDAFQVCKIVVRCGEEGGDRHSIAQRLAVAEERYDF